MMQVLEQVLENLYSRNNTPEDLKGRVPSHLNGGRPSLRVLFTRGGQARQFGLTSCVFGWRFCGHAPEAKSVSEPLLPT